MREIKKIKNKKRKVKRHIMSRKDDVNECVIKDVNFIAFNIKFYIDFLNFWKLLSKQMF